MGILPMLTGETPVLRWKDQTRLHFICSKPLEVAGSGCAHDRSAFVVGLGAAG